MAHNAPSAYERRFIVSNHAIDRVRERAADEVKHRDERSLGDYIDHAVSDALRVENYEEWWQEGRSGPEMLQAVDLKDYVDSDHLWAVVTSSKKSHQLVVKTVLTDLQKKRNVSSNKWVRDPESLGRSGLHAPLIDASKVSELKTTVKSATKEVEVKEGVVKRTADTRVRLTWADEHGEVDETVVANDDEAKAKIGQLLEAGIKPEEIEAWVPRPLKLKAKVVYDIEL